MSEFSAGHVKRNPNSGEVAIRTMFPEDPDAPQLMAMAWLVATTNIGARNASTDQVAEWEDLFVPGV